MSIHVYNIPPVRGLPMLWVSYDPHKDWLCLRVLLGKLCHFFRQGHERALLGARLQTLLQRLTVGLPTSSYQNLCVLGCREAWQSLNGLHVKSSCCFSNGGCSEPDFNLWWPQRLIRHGLLRSMHFEYLRVVLLLRVMKSVICKTQGRALQ